MEPGEVIQGRLDSKWPGLLFVVAANRPPSDDKVVAYRPFLPGRHPLEIVPVEAFVRLRAKVRWLYHEGLIELTDELVGDFPEAPPEGEEVDEAADEADAANSAVSQNHD
jgi:hypothetical protein